MPLALEPSDGVRLSFKCTPEEFCQLQEQPGVVPAPYLARYNWIGLETLDALTGEEIRRLIRCSYDLVFAKLPQKVQKELSAD